MTKNEKQKRKNVKFYEKRKIVYRFFDKRFGLQRCDTYKKTKALQL